MKQSELARAMLAAVRESLGDDWKDAKDWATPEIQRMARVLVDIGKLVTQEKITPAEAKVLLRIHRNTMQTIMLTVKGLGLLATENAVNAAIDAIRDVVNGAVGFRLV
ncbi:MAG: hypothetical protein R3B81_05850 [bacterium]